MKVYRLARKSYIKDLSGQGARLYGGRWNSKGTSMLYTASNRALATVEFLVHLPMALLPKDIYLVELTIPSRLKSIAISSNDLPSGWRGYPAHYQLQKIGDNWITDNKSLSLKVPSSVVNGETNILINPNHQAFHQVKITQIEPYNFDERLLKRK